LRPIFHWTAPRLRADVFLCMLAHHVEHHMRSRLPASTALNEKYLITLHTKPPPIQPRAFELLAVNPRYTQQATHRSRQMKTKSMGCCS
jgi:hypothetical protein